jgi:alkanesulfonate monooxygenase SsuD/methylene tetrahydromethanopterin reductase-like flavin-dependent oxidoreductase (luciferase family)
VNQHHPISLAKRVATLDHLSDGRFVFGVGAGWNVAEMANPASRSRTAGASSVSGSRR